MEACRWYLIGPNAYLVGADLGNSDLTGINLSNANLTDADLSNANLTDTNLSSTNLTNADLSNTILTNASGNSLVVRIVALILESNTKYSLEEISDLRVGSVMIEVINNEVSLSLQLEESSNLIDWIDTDETADFIRPAVEGKKFFRFRYK